ncbi:hypothetical protein [Streptomyces sp. NPDC059639]|uniref:hypothetical protein n=1 Tax=Streptomyces sp. NPDC059639 TaxID=3346891 RepID=UPI0036AF6D14
MPRIIALASPRTSSKTTNAAWLSSALHQRGYPVKAFDADLSHQLTDWHAANGWDFPCLGAASRMANKNIPAALSDKDVAVVDVGHLEEHLEIARAVLRVADVLLVNLVPAPADIERLEKLPLGGWPEEVAARMQAEQELAEPPTGFMEDVNSLRAEPLPVRILLSRCQPGTLAPRETRELMISYGYEVMRTQIPGVQRYALTGEGFALDPRGSAHDELVTELIEKGLL